MTFTSGIFLIGILPWFMVMFFLQGRRSITIKSFMLFLMNTLFYIWGGAGAFLFVSAYSLCIWLFGLIISKTKNSFLLGTTVLLSAAPLVFVKYTGFIIDTVNGMTGSAYSKPEFVIPIGISFFTFEAISFLADAKKEDAPVIYNPFDVYLYLTFFPTVTSGPIFRFNDFKEGLKNLNTDIDYVKYIERIILGMGKKLLVADKLAFLANYYFDGTAVGNTYSTLGLWIGSAAYTLQLYFDFSGYSDMAIGFGGLMGFNIPENFNRPYTADSISGFWKKWHISLSRWFRDYIYIPLGGNRCKAARHILNLLIVWILTGIWHGADWSFVVWGLGYFVLLTLEKYAPFMKKVCKGVAGHIYALFFINLLWVFFRADNMSVALRFVKGMFGGGKGLIEQKAVFFLPYFIFAIILCIPFDGIKNKFKDRKVYGFLRGLVYIGIVVASVCALVNASYAPYIYGNF